MSHDMHMMTQSHASPGSCAANLPPCHRLEQKKLHMCQWTWMSMEFTDQAPHSLHVKMH